LTPFYSVYDIGSRQSFEDIKEIWMEEADLHTTGAITKMIIGNKADRDQRAISQTVR
jgi:GTPase SAR1 family protein